MAKLRKIKITFGKGVEPTLGKITHSGKAAEICRDCYEKDQIQVREQMYAIYLNRDNRVLGYYEISKGGVSSTLVDVKLALAPAITALASAMILTHNHPSSNLAPSAADLRSTEKVLEACRIFDITLLDHIIINPEGGFYSFADHGSI